MRELCTSVPEEVAAIGLLDSKICCRTFALILPPSLLVFLNFCLNDLELNLGSSSPENVLLISFSSSSLGLGFGAKVRLVGLSCDLSVRPKAWSRVCVRLRRESRAGIGGASLSLAEESIPLRKLASGGRLMVSTEEVQEMKVGSEMSCLLIERLPKE